MMEFERQAEIMDMKEEMMNDAIDDAMGDEEDEEERLGGTPGMGRMGTDVWSSHMPGPHKVLLSSQVTLLCPRSWTSWD